MKYSSILNVLIFFSCRSENKTSWFPDLRHVHIHSIDKKDQEFLTETVEKISENLSVSADNLKKIDRNMDTLLEILDSGHVQNIITQAGIVIGATAVTLLSSYALYSTLKQKLKAHDKYIRSNNTSAIALSTTTLIISLYILAQSKKIAEYSNS